MGKHKPIKVFGYHIIIVQDEDYQYLQKLVRQLNNATDRLLETIKENK